MSPFLYRLAADALVLLHMAYVLFVLFGFLLTLLGMFRKWCWIRNPWFRSLHLAMVLIVVAEAWLGITCPLTTWEYQLRVAAGQETYRGSFVANLVHDYLFYDLPPWVFLLLYTLFATALAATWIFAWPQWKRKTEPAA